MSTRRSGRYVFFQLISYFFSLCRNLALLNIRFLRYLDEYKCLKLKVYTKHSNSFADDFPFTANHIFINIKYKVFHQLLPSFMTV